MHYSHIHFSGSIRIIEFASRRYHIPTTTTNYPKQPLTNNNDIVVAGNSLGCLKKKKFNDDYDEKRNPNFNLIAMTRHLRKWNWVAACQLSFV